MENSDQISEETVDAPTSKKLRIMQRVGPEVCTKIKCYYFICPFLGFEWELKMIKALLRKGKKMLSIVFVGKDNFY